MLLYVKSVIGFHLLHSVSVAKTLNTGSGQHWIPFHVRRDQRLDQLRHDKENQPVMKRPPNAVIVGLGDSGTRGVKTALESCGLHFCDYTNPSGDNSYTTHSHHFIRSMLEASDGEANNPDGYERSERFETAVTGEVKGASKTYECMLERYAPSQGEDVAWAYKNPAHFMQLPVMDAAFQKQAKFLAVSRDPRDICTGDNQNQLGKFGNLVLKDGWVDKRLNKENGGASNRKTFRRQQAKRHDCPLYWAKVWNASMSNYNDERLKVVRIEDLVVPNPTKRSRSFSVMRCVLNHVELASPSSTVLSALRSMHKFRVAYLGERLDHKKKASLEGEFATRFDEPLIHEMMEEIGYNTWRYALKPPRSKHVCW